MTFLAPTAPHPWTRQPQFREKPDDHNQIQVSWDGAVTWIPALRRLDEATAVRQQHEYGTESGKVNDTSWHWMDNAIGIIPGIQRGRKYLIAAECDLKQTARPPKQLDAFTRVRLPHDGTILQNFGDERSKDDEWHYEAAYVYVHNNASTSIEICIYWGADGNNAGLTVRNQNFSVVELD